MTQTFADYDIDTRDRTGTIKTTCPKCSQNRSHPKDPCLSVNTQKGIWKCHHCGWVGSLKGASVGRLSQNIQSFRLPIYQKADQYPDKLVAWFQARGIPFNVINRNKISLGKRFLPGLGKEVECIQFPYFRKGECVNVKYRALDAKAFMQEKGAEKIFYGLDDLDGCDWAIIVEGCECDKFAFEVQQG
ncbi:MAG: hypothetical protein R3B74_02885 [Nitrospirales bacterium]|nr:hypothetical protein [Nitrospirales bacterium]